MPSLKTLQGSPLDVDIDDVSDLREVHVDELGATISGEHGEIYQFVQFTDQDVDPGDVVQLADLSFDADGNIDTLQVTNDTAGGSAIATAGYGVAVASVTGSDDNYGWVQTDGPIEGVNTDNESVSVGDYIIASQSNDGEAASMSDGEEEQVIGICTEDNSSSIVSVLKT